jgi:NAD(P)-dependent dehydrogenase (short-subunit alcohol dehydrogenase family)
VTGANQSNNRLFCTRHIFWRGGEKTIVAFSYAGKVALVTGAGVRLGRAIALALAQRGCNIVIHYHSSKREAATLSSEIKTLGRQAVCLKADLSSAQDARKLVQAAEKAFGGVDILINSAAIFWPTPPEKLDERELDAFLSVNLKSPYVLASGIGRAMQKRGRGVIVNLSCVSALRPWKTFVPYSISKAGVAAMTVGMAKVLGPQVRVNAIAPGTVLPPESMTQGAVLRLKNALPLKKIGTPQDIVLAVLYLCEAEFVTGQVLCVDGGRSIV